MSVIVEGLKLVYSVRSVLGIYDFWFVPKEDRFSRGTAAAETEAKPVLQEQLAEELSLWQDRTRYDKSLKWQISVLEPSILFPADANDDEEPIIVLDLHRFLWGSEPLEAGVDGAASDPGSADNERYYSRSVMSTEKTRLRLVDDIGSWLHCVANRRASWVIEPVTLARDFDLSIGWNYCRLPEEIRNAADMPRHVLAGTLPSVYFRVKANQYCTFWYTFFKLVRSHWGTPQEQAAEAAKPRVPVPGSGRSMTFKFKMHELKLDMLEELPCAQENVVQTGEDISGEIADEAWMAFATMVLKGFVVTYENGNISKLDLHMDGLTIQDLFQGCVFASSDTDADEVPKGSFVCIQRGWAIPGAVDYPGHDTWWTFDFRTLALNWNDKTVALLMRFCSAAFATHRQALADADAAAAARRASSEASHSLSPPPANDAATPPRVSSGRSGGASPAKSRIGASFEMLSATLMRDGVPLTRLAMTAARCCYDACVTGECFSVACGQIHGHVHACLACLDFEGIVFVLSVLP